jgi:hypothetical protein
MKCANECGNDLLTQGFDWYCPECQSPEAISARYAAQFRSPLERALFEAAGPYGNSVLSVFREAK